MQQKYSKLKNEMKSFLAPFRHIQNACCARAVQAKIDKKLESRVGFDAKTPQARHLIVH